MIVIGTCWNGVSSLEIGGNEGYQFIDRIIIRAVRFNREKAKYHPTTKDEGLDDKELWD